MTTIELHNGFMARVNKLSTEGNPNFLVNQIDEYLTRAQLSFINKYYKYKTNRPSKSYFSQNTNVSETGFEQDQYSWSALANISVVSPQVQPQLMPTELSDGIYELNFSDLKFDIIFPTEVKAVVEKDKCEKLLEVDLFKLDTKKNYVNQPSFDYNKIHASFSRATNTTQGLPNYQSVYLDSTDVKGKKQYDVKYVRVSYVKHPKPVWIGTYDLTDDLRSVANTQGNIIYDSSTDDPVTLEISEFFHNEIIDIAVNLALNDWYKFLAKTNEKTT